MNPIGLDWRREATRQAASLRTYVRQHTTKFLVFSVALRKPDDERAEELTKVMLEGFEGPLKIGEKCVENEN